MEASELTFTNSKTEQRPEAESSLEDLLLSEKSKSVDVARDGLLENAWHDCCFGSVQVA